VCARSALVFIVLGRRDMRWLSFLDLASCGLLSLITASMFSID